MTYSVSGGALNSTHSLINFSYVSSPKFVQIRKVLLMSAACLSKF